MLKGWHVDMFCVALGLFCVPFCRERQVFKLAQNDQCSWTEAADRSSNHAMVSDFEGGHWGSVLAGQPNGMDIGAEGSPPLQASISLLGKKLRPIISLYRNLNGLNPWPG